MKKSQHTSKGLAQATMYETAQLINVSYKADIAKFKAFDPELNIMDLSDKLTTTLTEISDLDPDFMLEALQMEATKNVVDISGSALVNIRNARYYIEKAFPGDTLKSQLFWFARFGKSKKIAIAFCFVSEEFCQSNY